MIENFFCLCYPCFFCLGVQFGNRKELLKGYVWGSDFTLLNICYVWRVMISCAVFIGLVSDRCNFVCMRCR